MITTFHTHTSVNRKKAATHARPSSCRPPPGSHLCTNGDGSRLQVLAPQQGHRRRPLGRRGPLQPPVHRGRRRFPLLWLPTVRRAGDDALVCIQPLLGAAAGPPRGHGRRRVVHLTARAPSWRLWPRQDHCRRRPPVHRGRRRFPLVWLPVKRHAGDDALVCIQPLLGAAVGPPRGRGRRRAVHLTAGAPSWRLRPRQDHC